MAVTAVRLMEGRSWVQLPESKRVVELVHRTRWASVGFTVITGFQGRKEGSALCIKWVVGSLLASR